MASKKFTFPRVIETIRQHITKNLYGSAPALLERLFFSYAQGDPIGLDSASVSRWLSGSSPVRASISRFYLAPDRQNLLAEDISNHLLPLMADAGMVALELYTVVSTAKNLSACQKARLTSRFSTADDDSIAVFIAEVVLCSLKLTSP